MAKSATKSTKKEKKQDKVPIPEESSVTGAKKKTKFYNFYGQDGQTQETQLKGRHRCDCQAAKHKLVNNCLTCGRIVCEQEGSGACFFCGSLVCSEEEQRLIDSGVKKGDNLKKSLMEQNRPKGWQEAVSSLLIFSNCFFYTTNKLINSSTSGIVY